MTLDLCNCWEVNLVYSCLDYHLRWFQFPPGTSMDSRILSSKQPLNNDLKTQINVHLHESFIRDIVPSSNVHPHKTRGKHQKEYQGGVGADAANFQFFQLNKRLSQVFHLQRNIFYIFFFNYLTQLTPYTGWFLTI